MIKATVVVDNFCQKQGLYAEWGYAMHVETPSGNLLWDTGGFLHVLEHNLRFLGINPAAIENVALSQKKSEEAPDFNQGRNRMEKQRHHSEN